MGYLHQVQSGLDFIESRLESDISTGDVARHAGISQWHFQRIFKALTNETLKSYIRARRLANSLDQLLTTDLRILDIAMNAGYENQESYTRAFRQAFDMTPSDYRNIGRRALFLKKMEINASYIENLQSGISLDPVIYVQPERRLMGLRTRFYSVDSEKNNVAEKIPALWDGFLHRLPEISGAIAGTCYGALYRVEEHDDQLNYLAGIEVPDNQSIPEGMEVLVLPECRYAHFTHRGKLQQLDNTVSYIYSNWLLNSRHVHSYGVDLEIYGADYHPTSSRSVIHYAIPIR